MTRDQPNSSSPLEHAARLKTHDRIVALGEALRHAPGNHRDTMAFMLIELAGYQSQGDPAHASSQAAGPVELLTRLPARWRSRHADDALMGLARAWVNLSNTTKPLAVALGRDRWHRATAQLAKEPETSARLAALAIAHDTADPGLGKIVASLLSDEQQSVRRAADETILRLSLQLLDHLPASLLGETYTKIARAPSTPLPADPVVMDLERCTLLAAVADAAWSFAAHRCRSPLIAAMLLMDRAVSTPLEQEIGAKLRRLLSQRNHPSHAPLRSVLKRTDCPILRERAFRWLHIPAMSTAALDRLCIAESLIEHEIVLRRAHLAMRPSRASKLATLGKPRSHNAANVLPARKNWSDLSLPTRLGVVRFSRIISENEQTRRDAIEPALADPSTRVRLHSTAMCSTTDLPDFVFDPDPIVARHAVNRWSTLGIEPPRSGSNACSARSQFAQRNTRSPHAWVRRIAREEQDRLTMLDPHQPGARQQARRLLRSSPTGFARSMRDRLSDAQTRTDAITLIRMLGVERRFELDLIGIVQSEQSDERARASAVAALGRVGTKAAQYTLSESLIDNDPRTRANAIEVITLEPEQILEHKNDPHHRVRASAVRRVLGDKAAPSDHARSASSAMIELLADDRPLHRLAGVWAAQRTVVNRRRASLGTNWSPIVARLEELAAIDDDPRLRTRATCCIDRLSHELKSTSSGDG